MQNRICKICLLEKEDKFFYGHAGLISGKSNTCIECTKARSRARDAVNRQNPEWVEQEKIRAREKYHRLGYKEKHKPTPEDKAKAIAKYKQSFPEKYKAKNSSQRIKPQTPGNQMHHWSYNEHHHRDTIELSIQDHALLHRHTIYDQERMMYRIAKTGLLLDTKESHIELLNNLKQQS